VKSLDCQEWLEQIVESARRGVEAPERLESHLRACQSCRARWISERNLGAAMARLREALARERSPESRRKQLMTEFARSVRSRPDRPAWWAWSPAAAVVAVALLLLFAGARQRHGTAVPASAEPSLAGYLAVDEADGFLAVPYTQPLAPGELVRIVSREVNGTELAHMGFDVPAAYGGFVNAEVVLGEDGIPRAVRLAEFETF